MRVDLRRQVALINKSSEGQCILAHLTRLPTKHVPFKNDGEAGTWDPFICIIPCIDSFYIFLNCNGDQAPVKEDASMY